MTGAVGILSDVREEQPCGGTSESGPVVISMVLEEHRWPRRARVVGRPLVRSAECRIGWSAS